MQVRYETETCCLTLVLQHGRLRLWAAGSVCRRQGEAVQKLPAPKQGAAVSCPQARGSRRLLPGKGQSSPAPRLRWSRVDVLQAPLPVRGRGRWSRVEVIQAPLPVLGRGGHVLRCYRHLYQCEVDC